MKKTADNADAGVSRLRSSSLSSLRSDLLSQPLWSCQNYFQNQKATPKRLRQQVLPKAKQRRVARASASICVISGFFQIKPEMMIILLFPNTAKALAKTCTHTQKKEKLFSSQDTRSTQPAEHHAKCRYRTLCGIIRRRVVRHRTVSCGTVLHRALILSDQRISEHLAFCLA